MKGNYSMKNKKKIIWGAIAVVIVILAVFGYFRLKTFIADLQEQAAIRRSESLSSQTEVEVKNEIVFTGKVAPRYTQLVYLNSAMKLDEVLVEENEQVKKGDRLLTYAGAENINDLIIIQQAQFVGWQESLDWYQEKITALNNELASADPTNDGYVTALKKEIAQYQTLQASTNVKWNNAVSEIDRLKNSYDDYNITADFDGFVYQIDDSASVSLTAASAYLTLYSNEKIVTVEVSEYEMQYIQEQDEATITVEGLDKTYTGTITKIDIMPNNMTSSDTSYYNIEVSIPDEVPYGYSVVIALKLS
ncbi:hypothetical protein SDC9_111574 [bioreactor metagenome]|uniref:YknX-like beta-barrel domain-containing protein n=1 Tax=bioreactor metagenome TaxID=1076179 RepID=A0A645BHP0_9ZZZZ